MRFVTIPKNGSSWREPLRYTIDTESSEGQDVVVEVIDVMKEEVIGKKHLYGVTIADIDISAYVRNAVDTAPPSAEAKLAISPAAKYIALRIGDVVSERRLFFRATIDCSVSKMLSSLNHQSTIARGDVIRFTLYAKKEVKLWIIDKSLIQRPAPVVINTQGMPIEVAIPTTSFRGERVQLCIEVQCDGLELDSLNYTLENTIGSGWRLAWYNCDGGVECYNFPKAIREQYVAEVAGCPQNLTELVAKYRLVSAFEMMAEIERLIKVIFSPEVYECRGEECYPLTLTSRKVDFNDHGLLRQLELNVEKRWRRALC